MATQMQFLIGDYITVCSRIKHESSSSDEEHAAAKPPSTGHLPLLSSVSYRKTLRLTSEQLVSVSVPRPVPVQPPREATQTQQLGGGGPLPLPGPRSAPVLAAPLPITCNLSSLM